MTWPAAKCATLTGHFSRGINLRGRLRTFAKEIDREKRKDRDPIRGIRDSSPVIDGICENVIYRKRLLICPKTDAVLS